MKNLNFVAQLKICTRISIVFRVLDDPLWMTNYELIYSHPELQIPWYPILGNHEYRGNTQAVLDYSNVSRRWQMPARYYSKVFEEDGATLRVVFIAPPADEPLNEPNVIRDSQVCIRLLLGD